MAVMTGQAHLDKILPALCTHMRFWWQIAYLTPGCSSHLVWTRISPFYKPIILMVKQGATYKGKWLSDVIKAEPDTHGRELHKWQQSTHVFEHLINNLSEKGSVICDPFLGSGTTALCCAKMGRKFVGSDNDSECIKITQERVEDFFKEQYGCEDK
jgi:DNA modification methylase